MKRLIYFLTFSFCLVAIVTAATAHSKQTLTIAVPYIKNLLEKKDNGDWGGPLLESFAQIENATGLRIDFSVLPFSRAVELTKTNQVDLGIFLESPTRNKIAKPIAVLSKSFFIVIALKKNLIKAPVELIDKTIGINDSSAVTGLIKSLPHLETYKFKSHKDLMNSLLAGKVDAIVTPDFRFVEMVENLDLDYNLFSKPYLLSSQNLILYASQDFSSHTKLIETLKKIKFDGLKGFGIDKVFSHYPDE